MKRQNLFSLEKKNENTVFSVVHVVVIGAFSLMIGWFAIFQVLPVISLLLGQSMEPVQQEKHKREKCVTQTVGVMLVSIALDTLYMYIGTDKF